MPDESAERGVRQAVARLHAAMNQVAAGDPSAIKALYSHRDDVTGFYGWGGYEKGWEQVSRRWDWAAAEFKGGGPVTYQNLTTIVTAELACTTDIETFRVRLDAMDRPTEWSNRVTHVFRLEDGEWRLVHRHGNRLEPQYKPASRLEPPGEGGAGGSPSPVPS
jgi:ketosteroid isomerase-like protein